MAYLVTALAWIRSFLTNRSQSIKISFSEAVFVFSSVSQGSILAPLLFTLYTTPLSYLTHRHELDHHLYAYDTQV